MRFALVIGVTLNRCRAGVLPCPGPRTARRRSEL